MNLATLAPRKPRVGRSILDDIAEGEALYQQAQALERPGWATWQAVVTAGDALFDALGYGLPAPDSRGRRVRGVRAGGPDGR
jgi:hypothetical protein